MWIGYRDGKYFFQAGDINKSIESSLYGRGASAGISIKKFKFEAIGTQRVLNPQNNFGAELEFSPSQNYGFKLGGVYTESLNENFTSTIGITGFKLAPTKVLRIGYDIAYNKLEFGRPNDTVFNKVALGNTSYANYNTKKLNASVRFKAGQPFLNSSYNGRSELMSQFVYTFNDKNNINYYAIDNRNSAGDYRTYNLIKQTYTNFHKQLITWGYYPNNRVYFFTGPGFEVNSSDIFQLLGEAKIISQR